MRLLHERIDTSDALRRAAQDQRIVPQPLAILHELVAGYYQNELFEKSRDLHAFLEYIFHGVVSIGNYEVPDFDYDRYRSPQLLRLKWLIRAIERELGRLQITGPISALLHRLCHTRRWLVSWITFLEQRDRQDPRTVDASELLNQLGEERQRLDQSILEIWKGTGSFGITTEALSAHLFGHRSDRAAPDAEVQQLLVDAPDVRDAKAVAGRVRELRLLIELIHAADGMTITPANAGSRPQTGWRLLRDVAVAADHLRDALVPLGDKAAARLLEEVRQVRVRARLKSVEHLLRRIDPWDAIWDPRNPGAPARLGLDEATGNAIQADLGLTSVSLYRESITCCRKAERLVRAAQPTRRARRYKCYMYTLRGRAETLAGNFDRATVFFDRAKAALSRTSGAPEWTALAVMNLAEAESLLLQGLLSVRSPGVPEFAVKQLTVAEAFYERAESSLLDARSACVQGKRDNYVWSLFYLLTAQLRILQLRLKELNMGRCRLLRADDAIMDALHAIRSTRENLHTHDGRAKQLRLLERQLTELAVPRIGSDEFASMRIRAGLDLPPPDQATPSKPPTDLNDIINLMETLDRQTVRVTPNAAVSSTQDAPPLTK